MAPHFRAPTLCAVLFVLSACGTSSPGSPPTDGGTDAVSDIGGFDIGGDDDSLCPDGDGDGVCDADDLCLEGDDGADADADGAPDACDACADGDDSADADDDGSPDACDVCPDADDSADADADGVPDGCDICSDGDDNTDTDGDGIPNACDECDNTGEDGDGDGMPDDCDECPFDAADDSDGDGSCDSDDLCPDYDDTIDTDDDGAPDACDECPADAADDSDGDGSCDSDDLCDGSDDTIDTDDDGSPDGCDLCPDADDTADDDEDGVPDACDVCTAGDDAADADEDGTPDLCDCDFISDSCDAIASCSDDIDGAFCICPAGYTGDGTACEIVDCSAPSAPADGFVSAPVTAYGGEATQTCEEGYTLIGDSARTCQADGVWSGSVAECELVDCGPFGTFENGDISADGSSFGSTALHSCGDGYELVGEAVRTCEASGDWSGDAPVCNPVDCGDIDAPVNGSVSAPTTTYPALATYECDGGFTISGDATRSCSTDGAWTGSAPTCVGGASTTITIGEPTNANWAASGYFRGNAYLASDSRVIGSFGQYLTVPVGCRLDHYVFSGPASSGPWTQVWHSQNVTATAGEQYWTSGTVDYRTTAGAHYVLGVAWECSATYTGNNAAGWTGFDVGIGTYTNDVWSNTYPGHASDWVPTNTGSGVLAYAQTITSSP